MHKAGVGKSSETARQGAEADQDKLLRRTLEVMRGAPARARGQEDAAGPAPARKGGSRAERLWNKPSLMPEAIRSFVVDRVAHRRLAELILHDEVRLEVAEFLREHASAALLRSHSLEPRHKLLLVGPPGNGKTSLAEAVAFEAGLPFLTVRYDAMMDSLLGETAARLRRLMDFAASCPCVLFFDEFDSVGKERSDAQDVGEVKRVVGSLLVQLDDMPSHTIVICATNHPELLDRAVWRRFDTRLAMNAPGPSQLAEWFRRLRTSLGAAQGSGIEDFPHRLLGVSFSEVEQLGMDVRRKLILSAGGLSPERALLDAMARWSRRLSQEGVSPAHAGTPNHQARKRARRPRSQKGEETAVLPETLLF